MKNLLAFALLLCAAHITQAQFADMYDIPFADDTVLDGVETPAAAVLIKSDGYNEKLYGVWSVYPGEGADLDFTEEEYFIEAPDGTTAIASHSSDGSLDWVYPLYYSSTAPTIRDFERHGNYLMVCGRFANDLDGGEFSWTTEGTASAGFVLILDLEGNFIHAWVIQPDTEAAWVQGIEMISVSGANEDSFWSVTRYSNYPDFGDGAIPDTPADQNHLMVVHYDFSGEILNWFPLESDINGFHAARIWNDGAGQLVIAGYSEESLNLNPNGTPTWTTDTDTEINPTKLAFVAGYNSLQELQWHWTWDIASFGSSSQWVQVHPSSIPGRVLLEAHSNYESDFDPFGSGFPTSGNLDFLGELDAATGVLQWGHVLQNQTIDWVHTNSNGITAVTVDAPVGTDVCLDATVCPSTVDYFLTYLIQSDGTALAPLAQEYSGLGIFNPTSTFMADDLLALGGVANGTSLTIGSGANEVVLGIQNGFLAAVRTCALDSDIDNDGVGLTCDNCQTTANPTQADWNADGIGDACQDSDQDGLTDEEELLLGTNLEAADSDFDGLTDGAEVNLTFTNPLLSDSDDDGCPDLMQLLKLCPGQCEADFNNNGMVDGPDLLYMIGVFGTVCP